MSGLLRQNSELAADGIWNWTLPAFYVEEDDGSRFMTCPHAGACARLCYARSGTYMIPAVAAFHHANLRLARDHPVAWIDALTQELRHWRFRPTGRARELPFAIVDEWLAEWAQGGGVAVRIHDSGDFFSRAYLEGWAEIASATPDVLFYAYTKEVTLLREWSASTTPPANMRWLYSLGGTEDHLLDLDRERHADVFPDEDSIAEAGYLSQGANDLYAILLDTTRVGISANRIPKVLNAMKGRRFMEMVPPRFRAHESPLVEPEPVVGSPDS